MIDPTKAKHFATYWRTNVLFPIARATAKYAAQAAALPPRRLRRRRPFFIRKLIKNEATPRLILHVSQLRLSTLHGMLIIMANRVFGLLGFYILLKI